MEFLIPFHPKVVHFPIALFTSALGLDILSYVFRKESFHKTAFHIYVLAAIISPFVVKTGFWEEARLQLSHPILVKHRMFALATMWMALISLPILWFVKKKGSQYFRFIFILFLISITTLVSFTGFYGGQMVYEYAVSVEQ